MLVQIGTAGGMAPPVRISARLKQVGNPVQGRVLVGTRNPRIAQSQLDGVGCVKVLDTTHPLPLGEKLVHGLMHPTQTIRGPQRNQLYIYKHKIKEICKRSKSYGICIQKYYD